MQARRGRRSTAVPARRSIRGSAAPGHDGDAKGKVVVMIERAGGRVEGRRSGIDTAGPRSLRSAKIDPPAPGTPDGAVVRAVDVWSTGQILTSWTASRRSLERGPASRAAVQGRRSRRGGRRPHRRHRSSPGSSWSTASSPTCNRFRSWRPAKTPRAGSGVRLDLGWSVLLAGRGPCRIPGSSRCRASGGGTADGGPG